MSTLLAFLSLAFLALSSLIYDGSSRLFEATPKAGVAPLSVSLDASDLHNSKSAETFIWEFGDGEKLTTNTAKINLYLKMPAYSPLNLNI